MSTKWNDITPNPKPAAKFFELIDGGVRCFVKEKRKSGRWVFDVQVNVFMGYAHFAKGDCQNKHDAMRCAEAIAEIAKDVYKKKREGVR